MFWEPKTNDPRT